MKSLYTEVLKIPARNFMRQTFILCIKLKCSSQHFVLLIQDKNSPLLLSQLPILRFPWTFLLLSPLKEIFQLLTTDWCHKDTLVKSGVINSQWQHLSSGWLSRDVLTALRAVLLLRRLMLNIDHGNFRLFPPQCWKLFYYCFGGGLIFCLWSLYILLCHNSIIYCHLLSTVPSGKLSPRDFN